MISMVHLRGAAVLGLVMAAGCGSDAVSLPIRVDGGACGIAPPTGFTQVVPARQGVGEYTRITASRAGWPLIAYAQTNANHSVTTHVVRWDPCRGRWMDPQLVDTSPESDAAARSVSVTTDPLDGRIVVAYLKRVRIAMPNPTHQVWVATSTDDGANFTTRAVSRHEVQSDQRVFGDINDTDHAEVLARGGTTWVAYNQGAVACHPDPSAPGGQRCNGGTVIARSEGTDAFSQTIVREPGGAQDAWTRPFQLGFAMPVGGTVPAVVAHLEPPSGSYNTALIYHVAGQRQSTLITDSANQQNDDGYAALAFVADAPRVLSRLRREPAGTETYDLLFSSTTSIPIWTTTTAAIPLPRDGGEHTAGALALISRGTDLVAISQSTGDLMPQCGGPKILRSNAGAPTAWTVCGAHPQPTGRPAGRFISGRFDARGKLELTYQENLTGGSTTPDGVVYWREP